MEILQLEDGVKQSCLILTYPKLINIMNKIKIRQFKYDVTQPCSI